MAADRKCCVPGCDNTRENNVLHRFPNPEKESNRFRNWAFAVGGNILALDDTYVYKYRRICHLHFEEKYWTRSKMLSKNSMPTLHLKGAVVRRPLADTTNINVTECIQETATTSKSGAVVRRPLADSTNINVVECNQETATTLKSGMKSDMKNSTKPFTSKEVNKLQKKIEKLTEKNEKYTIKIKKALRLAENRTFQTTLKKFTTLAAIFTALQFREINKGKTGRRFTEQEKIMALSIYKLGPRCYRFLKKVFVLPSPLTLSRMVSRAALKPGLNDNIFKHLKRRANRMKPEGRLCCLLFDEMSLTPHFNYNRKMDKICGFVNNGTFVRQEIADHVLVIMVRGIFKNYKQPISYTFCAGTTKREDLIMIIKSNIRKLHTVGFTVLATVCDQATANVSTINYLIEETRVNYLKEGKELKNKVFEIDGMEVIPIFDVPHLLKGIRNNLLNKDLHCKMDGIHKIGKWDHIKLFYENMPSYKGIKLVKKISDYHCDPEKIPKMKVKFATQIFSQTVGVNMGYLAANGLLPEECRETADIILFFDELFDSMNGSFINSSRRSGKPLLQALTPKSHHHQIWTKAKRVLKLMKFVSKEGKVCVVPSLKNWLHTIENMECLCHKLFYEYNFKSIWCRHFNQDPLENFFSNIRSHGYRNNSPTCSGFEAAFASLLVNNLSSSYSPASNCEEDSCQIFNSMKKIFFTNTKITSNSTELNLSHLYNDHFIVDLEIKKRDLRVIAALQYVTGYILKQCRIKIFKNCEVCNSNLYDANKATEYLKIREYNQKKAYLTYPSEKLVETFSEIQDIVYFIIKNNSSIYNIRNYIKVILYTRINTNYLKCDEHRSDLVDQIFTTSVMLFICNWCRDINKILRGSLCKYDKEDNMQLMAASYYNKRRRK